MSTSSRTRRPRLEDFIIPELPEEDAPARTRGTPWEPVPEEDTASSTSVQSQLAQGPSDDLDPSEWLEKRFPNAPDLAGPVFRVKEDGAVRLIAPNALARRLGVEGGTDAPIIYVSAEEQFYRFDPKEGIYAELARDDVGDVVDKLFLDGVNACADEYTTDLANLRSPRRCEEVAKGLQMKSNLDMSRFKFDGPQLPVENGLLDLSELSLEPLTRHHYARWKLGVPWKENAAEPERFREFLAQLFPVAEDRELALQVMAMTLLGNPFQKVVFLRGAGRSGKSTFVKLLTELVGPGSGSLNLSHAEKRFAALPWQDKLLLHQAEADTEMIETNARILKLISGQDPITAEQKNRNDRIEFTPRALPLLTSNQRLRVPINGDREAWEGRLLVLNTGDEPIPEEERVDRLEEKLLHDEGAGILRVVAETASDLLARLDAGDGFPRSDRQVVRQAKVLRDADPLETFIDRYVVKDPDAELEQPELVAAYRRFLEENGMEPPANVQVPSDKKEFIESLGGTYARSVGDNQRGWRGVRLTWS